MEATHEILTPVHALCLQTMHEMGSIRELDRTLAQTLLAESARVQLIIGENFTKSLIGLLSGTLVRHCEDLESSPDDPASHQVKATLQRFQQATSLKVNLPLMELEAAQEDVEDFLRSRLREISSQTES